MACAGGPFLIRILHGFSLLFGTNGCSHLKCSLSLTPYHCIFLVLYIFFSLEFVHAIPAMCKFQKSNTKILFSILRFLKEPSWIVNKQACWSQAARFKSCPPFLNFLVIGKLTILFLSHLQIGLIKDIYFFGFLNSLHDLILYRPSMIPGIKKAFQWGECLFSCI